MLIRKKVGILILTLSSAALITSLVLSNWLLERITYQVQNEFYSDYFKYINSEVVRVSSQLSDTQLLNSIAGLEEVSASHEKELKAGVAKKISEFSFGDSGYFYVIDLNEEVASSQGAPRPLPQDVIDQVIEQGRLQIEFKLEGSTWLIGLNWIPDWNWIVVAQAEKNELLRDRSAIFIQIAILLIIILVSINWLLAVYFRRIHGRIQQTLGFLRKVQEGIYTDRLAIDNMDEIGELETGINAMLDKVQRRNEMIELASQELKNKNELLDKMAMTDQLTGLANRHRLESIAPSLLGQARRDKVAIVLLMMDVDYFKKYNDHYGHVAGDHCLEHIGKILRAPFIHRRPNDLSVRIGGEEFLILLYDSDLEHAQKLADQIHNALALESIEHLNRDDKLNSVTVSIGIYSNQGQDIEDLEKFLIKADHALYQAKSTGRNKTHLFIEPQ